MPATACKNDLVSINFTGQAGTSAVYTWDFDNGTIATGSGVGPYNIIWDMDSIKNVSLSISENGCSSDITSHFINIISTPAQITAMGSTSFCTGGSVSLSANAGNYSYQWYNNGMTGPTSSLFIVSTAGNYSVEVTDNATGCSNTSDTVEVTVNTNDFNISFTANPVSFNIPPFNTTFTNNTQDANDYYWNWSFGDGNTSTFVNPAHEYLYDGTYSVGLVAQNIATGCFDTLTKTDYITCTGGSANPCTLDATIASNGIHQICPTDSVKLWSIDHTAGVSYQWLRDGVLLAGANDSIYYASTSGLYQLMLSDASCTNFSNPYSLTQYSTVVPSVLANGAIQPCTNDSMELYVSTSYNSYQWSNGENMPSIYVKTSGSYIVTVTDNNGCLAASDPFVVNASLLQVPDICIVGIDELTNHNRVVWERQNSAMIDSFKIYRESTVAGVYDLIGSQPFSTLSVFEDINSNPAQQAYRYRITAVDTCGMETAPSPIHKTLHLTINAGLGGVWNLIWTNYEGFNFGSYRIYRSIDSTNMQLLTQIQSTMTSYTDLNPPAGDVFYQIEIVSPHPCYPDSIYTKANTNYNTSRSNTANSGMAINNGFVHTVNNDLNMMVYPNPNKGDFVLEVNSTKVKTNQTYTIEVYSAMGKMVYHEKVDAAINLRKAMHFETMSKGIYFIRLQTDDSVLNTRFVLE
jgi:PKD repeat protein